MAGVKLTVNPEIPTVKLALQLVVCAVVLKVNAASVINNSVNNFFINKILISNVSARMNPVGRGFSVKRLLFSVRYRLF